MEAKIEKKQRTLNSKELADLMRDCVLEKKGKEVVELDMRELTEAFCDYFIICHGTSTTQVKSIADFIVYKFKTELGEFPISQEGMKNAEWVLVDFGSVVAHIFLKDRREFYQLEELWGDAKITSYSEEGDPIV